VIESFRGFDLAGALAQCGVYAVEPQRAVQVALFVDSGGRGFSAAVAGASRYSLSVQPGEPAGLSLSLR
jgi:hypothetical protein